VFAALLVTAAMLAPGASLAQDVMVLPPTTEAAASAPTPIPVVVTPDTASADAVPTALPVTQASVPTMLPVAAQTAAATTATIDPKALQCATDADCVLVTDGCGALDTVNQLYAANWKATKPVVADCQPVMDLTRAQLAVEPVCRNKQCGQQAKANK
jgi:hypothetical protein